MLENTSEKPYARRASGRMMDIIAALVIFSWWKLVKEEWEDYFHLGQVVCGF